MDQNRKPIHSFRSHIYVGARLVSIRLILKVLIFIYCHCSAQCEKKGPITHQTRFISLTNRRTPAV